MWFCGICSRRYNNHVLLLLLLEFQSWVQTRPTFYIFRIIWERNTYTYAHCRGLNGNIFQCLKHRHCLKELFPIPYKNRIFWIRSHNTCSCTLMVSFHNLEGSIRGFGTCPKCGLRGFGSCFTSRIVFFCCAWCWLCCLLSLFRENCRVTPHWTFVCFLILHKTDWDYLDYWI